ncbi:hypothetical protein A3D11_02245 [Candidatus Peribacteria bacterium RIFCSPHIGHO2_02_FULL_49_16]|nr:MAG: hypothetical protein A2880_03705 [Candidatus Peribacteria bacterium RIFCSPHIGHO2_01_FULL_49_38]OGJ59947.1 MAG: hypothetical protein A3D11_02245 [Candidatus Peribacteria bacterium RIFCSPHIGHO2_02_FULL_49_16]
MEEATGLQEMHDICLFEQPTTGEALKGFFDNTCIWFICDDDFPMCRVFDVAEARWHIETPVPSFKSRLHVGDDLDLVLAPPHFRVSRDDCLYEPTSRSIFQLVRDALQPRIAGVNSLLQLKVSDHVSRPS